ncbi:bifunctional tRNA (5-methylaminomethyl-2-thiouridine)(34)-methyltransferase MnmD/FAD-dependent 5-carboxymethylaminomethyl-2-thiouridine(34) oxidoreductase MnmC [Aliiglaciecola sp. 3_MG-2023]|uniref:bifunctional tRNA (5-methylaminomethyl-2-thiouridine)(34)-methyltransferase MnmD/FAD-dependent 5-carboxymethylaminomethyl-2-thiouridine(34) oxidoreductase MnmC n=1 Tax=Aliiglaciecola sp. 3_MG-2023 TaxID=3062644 RepID=UPI0026E1CB61|nr:bifunctional tRNA (5-methylaminomethyl-2-thiouridine)(34)-methyltransferase MnmD/FAD-dependent 5-carboxymethylaminomethyl-2-thiouridine(34) oxidoreductase MnmC [Aliiglaciecola sp. 3_MG-2023]MDO6695328.1 bifunctional tRNA (5-methylaminomethyl-2-thiouridine)(34)-methyltransferase MnmD/FAD-dependent 5-carboxymethylaminomethyl-2-thiouridine(34) oxidoreductase MnmC [Aliiglaciecola sp. 3_MG-2023]
MTIQPATIVYNSEGTPVAEDFDDVYFSNHNGLEESRYVFLKNNQLPERWTTHNQRSFVIAETGFGTGLNFLAVWQLFEQYCQSSTAPFPECLHFISCEKFPIPKADLITALDKWPELKHYAMQLTEHYPDLVAGCHRLSFAQGRVILDLWLGEATEVFASMHNQPQGLVDAWFLDGFAPSKNPEMWNSSLYQQMARLSKQGASFATFTAAGIVKRGLAEQGFDVKKAKGFGRKRDMLVGHFDHLKVNRRSARYFQRHGLAEAVPLQKQSIGIIGGGIAAANLALSLVHKGCKVTLMCKDAKLAQGASGNPQGGFYPQLNAEANIASRIQAISFGFACRRYHQLLKQGYQYAHQWCGVLQLGFNHKVLQRQQNLLQNNIWPESLITYSDPQRSTLISGIDLPYEGLFIPQGGWLTPADLVDAMLQMAKDLGDCEVLLGADVSAISESNGQWNVELPEKYSSNAKQFDALVIATGSDISNFTYCDGIPFQMVRGQVEAIPTQAPLDKLQSVLCHKGYLTPALNGCHALGSTYIKEDTNLEYRHKEQTTNLEMHKKALANTTWADGIYGQDAGRAAVRCSLPDHLPAVGAAFDPKVQSQQFKDLYKALPIDRYAEAQDLEGLFIFAGLGSRGLTTAPLLSELLASQICNEPLPMEKQLLDALNPNRFLIKNLIRRNDS